MLICFNASSAAKEALDTLTATGSFKDASEAISVALISYQAISEALTKNATTPLGASLESLLENGISTSITDVQARKAAIPELFRLQEFADLRCPDHPPQTTQLNRVRPHDWLFGQFNKFLPLKASCRCLANLQKVNLNGVPLQYAQEEISGAASRLGDVLLKWDRSNKKKRDDALSSAFPESSLNGSQGRLRFSNQFIGNIRQGRLHGFPSAMRLVTSALGRDPTLSLTRSGQAFAQLENPVLDAKDSSFSGRRLSDSEIEFLRNHIRAYVPEEFSAYITILQALETGANTPDKIDMFLRQRFHLMKDAEITTTFLTTQRTGAISRMVDLDLIERDKQGLRVTYFPTPAGSEFTLASLRHESDFNK